MYVKVDNLRASFGSFVALHGVSLEARPGQLVTLLGPSGCGKTTLLRSIAGIVNPTSGTIFFDGRRINDIPIERRNIGMVFQTYALFPHMTVRSNLAFGLEMRRVPKPEAHLRVEKALALVELGKVADRYPRQLSGGQQQRVALARAIVIEPSVLLFDEPLSNLDAQLRESLREDLKALQRQLGITSIYVTHDQAEAMALADHIVVMREGAIVEQGAPQTLYRRPTERYVAEFLGHTNVVPAELGPSGTLRLPWGAVRPAAAGTEPSLLDDPVVSLRPEDIGLVCHEGTQPSGEASGIVEDVTFLGPTVQYKVRIAGLLIRVHVSGESNEVLSGGRSVRLIPPETLHVLRDSLSQSGQVTELAP